MVTVDQSMGGSDEIDYADFATQMVSQAVDLEPNQSFNVGLSAIEPLRGRGGLSNNEVAELVYLETSVSFVFDDFQDDQNVATSLSAEGVIGINLDDFDDPVQASTIRGDDESLSGGPSGTVESSIVTDNAYLQQFHAVSGLPFDDNTGSAGGGPGGNASADGFYAEKYFRDTHGRGPVLDQTDDITMLTTSEVGDSIIRAGTEVLITMYWDVAETSDAGRRFSVP